MAGPDFEGMQLTEVIRVLDALADAGIPAWLEGGGGVDALVGHQTRAHRDVDVDIDASQEAEALAVLQTLGYEIETDWRPNRVELGLSGLGWIDVHPLQFQRDGSALQAGLNATFFFNHTAYFESDRLDLRAVLLF